MLVDTLFYYCAGNVLGFKSQESISLMRMLCAEQMQVNSVARSFTFSNFTDIKHH